MSLNSIVPLNNNFLKSLSTFPAAIETIFSRLEIETQPSGFTVILHFHSYLNMKNDASFLFDTQSIDHIFGLRLFLLGKGLRNPLESSDENCIESKGRVHVYKVAPPIA